jgi:hypothetical protein
MPVSVACLLAASTPKAGHQAAECEDRLAIGPDGLAFAVADGASEASFARLWAGILVQRFVEQPAHALEEAWVTAARQAFVQSLDWGRLPWHALEKLRRGSHAALAGVVIHPEDGSFEVRAWGDACVAWVNGETVSCAPFSRAADMPDRPYLISTVPAQNDEATVWPPAPLRVKLLPGITLVFLMTDALARWFLAQWTAGLQPWYDLVALDDEAALAAWADTARAQGILENDDVAVISLHIVNSDEVDVSL